MTIRVKIDHIGAKGDGIVNDPHGPIYVPFSVDGDDLDIKLQGDQGRIKHIHMPSADRVKPVCQHYGRCGGCALQHVSGAYYADWKKEQIRIVLRHRGFEDVTVLDPEISPQASRRRTRLNAIGRGKGAVTLGFSERASHIIVDIGECPVLAPEIVNLLTPLRQFLGRQLDKQQKMAVQINLAENGADLILEGSGDPDLNLRMDIAEFAEKQDIARICWLDTKLKKPSHEILCERRKPFVTFDGHQLFLPPGSFLQATKAGERALTRFMKEIIHGADKIVDLFAGCGTFTAALISDHAVHAVEGNRDMLDALKNSSHQMGAIRHLSTEVRDLFLRPLLPHELKDFAAAVIDPPRAGARNQVEEIAKSDLKCVAMISCNPSTFARDARILVDAGFVMGDILPVDQFLYSPHLEVIAGFRRGE